MELIAILFCLALQRFANIGGWFKVSWFEVYLKWLGSKFSRLNERLLVPIVIAPFIMLFAFIHLIAWHWSSVIYLVSAVVVVLFCIDARDLKNRLESYFQALEKGDMHEAAVAVNDFISDSSIGDIADLRREVTRAILLSSFEKIFAGLFWLILFGVYGLAVYFLIVMLGRTALRVNSSHVDLAKFSEKIQVVMEWLPVRLVGFSYALVGRFNKGFSYCLKNLFKGFGSVKDIAIDSGFAALDIDAGAEVDEGENGFALDMVNRVLILWVVGAVLVFVGSWL